MAQTESHYDLLVIGGGINGAGIAADAAGRGLNVVLMEKSDLASATSSMSSKLIHGGLRYLEFYEFALVRKSLKERELLSRAAPHLIRPIAFQIPILPHSRNNWMLRAGLFLYDHLAPRRLYKGSRSVRYEDGPLNEAIQRGFEYWDGQVDDARLTILNAVQASQRGALIQTRTRCVKLSPTEAGWCVQSVDENNQRQEDKTFSAVVNAGGPWVAEILENLLEKGEAVDGETKKENQPAQAMHLVKGSHIVVPKLHDDAHAFLLQHHDGRIIFVIPYLQNYSLVGTTEVKFDGDLDAVEISPQESRYLIQVVNLYFKKSLMPSDIVNSYSGVRPLIGEEAGLEAEKESKKNPATKISRDYRLQLQMKPHPLLTIYGGKVTTYRVLAETAVDMLADYFPNCGPAWTSKAKLPGGDFELTEKLFQEMAADYAWLGPDLIARWLRSYGTLSYDILGEASGMEEFGVRFGANLYQREVDYLCTTEWAKSADDILWRRSKLGYQFTDSERKSLANYISQVYGSQS